MAYDPRIFNINPYYDDFDADKGFLRVLFKPGYALQARELTQLQTILQDQISKIGDHLFKDGSRIVGGGISVRNSSYIRVRVGDGTALEGVTDYSSLVGGVLLSPVTGDTTEAKIVHYIEPDADYDNHLILVVDFVSGTAFSTGVCNFSKDSVTLNGLAIPTQSYPTAGNCKLVTVSSGIFYVDGFFARTDTQHFSPYTTTGLSYRDLSFSAFETLSKKIGFTVTRDSITEQEDSTLRDPAIGSYNYNAPGADRYKVVLTLDQTDLDATTDDFVELLRFESGKITKKVDRITYGEIEKALARRTYDESGSYMVNPFDLTVKNGTSDSALSLSIGSGKAYVLGHEVENVHPQTLQLGKARTTQTETGQSYPFGIGNYLGVCMGNTASGFGTTFSTNLATISMGSAEAIFRNASGAIVGRGRVHGALPTPERAVTSGPGGATGYYYRLFFYGMSGSAATAITANLYNSSGHTLGQFVPQTGTVFGAFQGANDLSLLYELQPGYALDAISSVKVYTKLVGDVSTPVSVSTTGNSTTYTVNKSHFSSTIGTDDSSVFAFQNYGTNNVSSDDISEISFVRGDSIAFSPRNGTLSTNSSLNEVTLTVTGAPTGFTAGTAGSLRAVMPVVYTPNIATLSTYRYKVSTNSTQQFTTTNFSTDALGRKFFTLNQADVYAVSSVTYTSGSPAVTTDVTQYFELDDGQRETNYTNGRIFVKDSETDNALFTVSGVRTITVSFSYFDHQGLASAPFIGKHSYVHSNNPNFSYDKIPLYTNPRTGKTVSLANCLDFRRTFANSTTQMIKPYGLYEFGSAENTAVSYSHYLPRIDKLCVKADPEDGSPLFFLVSGTPDLSPVAPPDPAEGLVIAVLTVPAYTHDASDVVITPVDSRRYTMADIGKIEKRVDEVEVFAKLSLSESEIEARSLRTAVAATEPLKTSILSDEFYGHSVADVSGNQHLCSIDFERGELRPFFRTENISFGAPSHNGTTLSSDGLLTLSYSGATYISNNQYTKTVKINPSNTVNWLGFMKLSRSVEPYYDTGYRPVVKTNALMENDNWLSSNANNDRGFGTQWNDWESLWTGIEQIEEEQDDVQKRIVELPHANSDSAIPSVNSGSVRFGVSRKIESTNQKTSNFIRTRRLKNRIKKTIGSRVVDQSVVPYIPVQTNITATVRGLKPNVTGLSLYFDGEVVKTGISTDASGSCSVSFGISAGTFLSGSRVVRISDSAVVANSTIAAEAVYHCTGVLSQRESGSYSTRPPELRRQLTSSETVSKDPFNRDIDSVESTHWSDPLSQTFFVDKKTNPNGIFLSSVSLYFSKKDSALPVTVQIRPTISGYPSPSVVLPFSTVTLLPSAVNANSVSPTETQFAFSSPVYLEPGEYAICVLANSDDYELYAADSAINGLQNQDATTGRAGNNQLVGTLFAPQGIGSAVADNVTDLMFKVKRCEFQSNGTVNYTVSSATNAQVLNLSSSEIIPEGSTISRTIGTENNSVTFLNRESLYLTSLFTSNPTLRYTMTRGSDTTISPVVDTQTLYAASMTLFSPSALTRSTYVSRVVELPQELSSNGLAVFVDSNIPTGSSIAVYYRFSVEGEDDIFSKTWQTATRVTGAFNSTSEIDFREVYFRVAPTSSSFKSYQIRVDLLTNSSSQTYYKTPAARNIRTVSFIQ
jgi:hypothetical protein